MASVVFAVASTVTISVRTITARTNWSVVETSGSDRSSSSMRSLDGLIDHAQQLLFEVKLLRPPRGVTRPA